MLKFITTTFCCICFAALATAQVGFKVEELHHVLAIPDTNEIEQVLLTHVKNTSNALTTFKWERKTLCTDPGYGNSVCIGSVCYEQSTDSKTFDLAPGDSTELSMHQWKNGPGNATADIEVKLYPVNNPANFVVLTFKYGVCTTIGTTEIGDFSELRVFPNPVTNLLFCDRVSEASVVHVYDQAGSLVLTHNLTQSTNLDVTTIKSGTYVLRFLDESSKKQSVRIVTKQ